MLKVFAVLCLLGTSAANNVPAPSPSVQSPSPAMGRQLQASPPPPTPAPTGPSAAVIGGSVAAGVAAITGVGLAIGLSPHDNNIDTANCAINGARAVDDMLDSAVFILASITRCDGGDAIRCEVDVASAIESVNKMINVILKAIQGCGGFQEQHEKCGLAVGVLTRSMAGLAAASGGIVAKCPNKLNGGHPMETAGSVVLGDGSGFSNGFGQCMINIKDSVKSLFKAIKRIMTIKESCEDPKSEHCTHNSLKIVAAFTGLAEYISGSIAQCSANSKNQDNALCSQMSFRLFHALDNLDRAGNAMSVDCALTPAQRLYLDNEKVAAPASSNSSLTLALAALLPITAVVAFVGGKRLAKGRSQVADCESGLE